jgi:PAS domain S-box-containing protein
MFVLVSPASTLLTGYTPDELIGRPVFELLFPNDVREVQAGFSRMLQKPKVRTTLYRIHKKDGGVVWFETVSTPIMDESGQVKEIMCVSRDVTERKKAEQAVQTREKHFERLLNATPILMWLSDHDGKYFFFNESWLKFTSRPLQDMHEDGWTKSVHEDDLLRIRKNYRRHAHALQPFSHEYRLRDASGTYHWILEYAVPRFTESATFLGYMGTCVDVSDLKSVQAELKSNNRALQQFKFAFDSTPDQMIISDRDGYILYANEAAERTTGYSIREMLGKKLGSRELWGGYMTKEYYQRLWEIVKKNKQSFAGKVYNRQKNGVGYWAEISIHPLLGLNGGVKYFIATERVLPDDVGEPQNVAQSRIEFAGKQTI